MEFIIKRFESLTAHEIYAILQLRSEVFVVEQNCVYQDIDYKDFKGFHFLLIIENELVGYLRILDKNVSYNEISIGRVVVRKSHRGKGFAVDIMKKAIEFIENQLLEKSIRISAQLYLKEFYSNLGFNSVSEVYLEDDIPHIEMLKN